jgi:UPF0755 protein
MADHERGASEREAARLERARRRASRQPGPARYPADPDRSPARYPADPDPSPADPGRSEDVAAPRPELTGAQPDTTAPDPGSSAEVPHLSLTHHDAEWADASTPALNGRGPDGGEDVDDDPRYGHGDLDRELEGGLDPELAELGGDLDPALEEDFDRDDDDGDGPSAGAAPGLADADREVASGTRRVSRLDGARQERHARSVRRRQRPVAARRGPLRWVKRIVSLIALVLAAAVIWFLITLFQPFGTSPHGQVTVTVAPHSGSRAIGNQLARAGVIPSGLFFTLRAELDGDRGQLRAGSYHLQLGMTYSAVLTVLTRIPKAAPTTELTISEGHTRAYVSALLHAQKIKGNYLAATRSSPLLDPHSYGAPRQVPSLEGFLFPDTFSLLDPVKVSALVADQLQDFKRRFASVNLNYARSRHVSAYAVIKIASLVEAEAASATARPLVASVIYNRLADGMMLQLDSTTRYATGNFTGPITVSQLRSPSPYNTHTHFGLPPTPIDSPGMAALQAAAHPARSHYLFFFSKPCTNQSAFATSYSQFLTLLARDKRTHC